jgi:hypothetical protein
VTLGGVDHGRLAGIVAALPERVLDLRSAQEAAVLLRGQEGGDDLDRLDWPAIRQEGLIVPWSW